MGKVLDKTVAPAWHTAMHRRSDAPAELLQRWEVAELVMLTFINSRCGLCIVAQDRSGTGSQPVQVAGGKHSVSAYFSTGKQNGRNAIDVVLQARGRTRTLHLSACACRPVRVSHRPGAVASCLLQVHRSGLPAADRPLPVSALIGTGCWHQNHHKS